MNDNLWTVVKPRNGDAQAVAEMNTKLLAFAPDTPARHDPECRKIARSLMESERPSFAEMVRTGMEPKETCKSLNFTVDKSSDSYTLRSMNMSTEPRIKPINEQISEVAQMLGKALSEAGYTFDQTHPTTYSEAFIVRKKGVENWGERLFVRIGKRNGGPEIELAAPFPARHSRTRRYSSIKPETFTKVIRAIKEREAQHASMSQSRARAEERQAQFEALLRKELQGLVISPGVSVKPVIHDGPVTEGRYVMNFSRQSNSISGKALTAEQIVKLSSVINEIMGVETGKVIKCVKPVGEKHLVSYWGPGYWTSEPMLWTDAQVEKELALAKADAAWMAKVTVERYSDAASLK